MHRPPASPSEEIYLDNNATTRPLPDVVEAVADALHNGFGNASSVHRAGERARELLRSARQGVADAIGVEPRHVVFTSGATEANNLVLQGLCSGGTQRLRLVTIAVEHSSILEVAERLRREGGDVVVVPVDSDGIVDVSQVANSIVPGRTLVSIQWANNETGVLQPVADIAGVTRDLGALFHTDAAQAVGKVDVDLGKLPIDLLTLSGHKVHGPVGVGAVAGPAVSNLRPMMSGGSQEDSVRPGTENVPGIVGLAVALEHRQASVDRVMLEIARLRDRFESTLITRGLVSAVNGSGAPRLQNTSNVRFANADGEALAIRLDRLGVRCSQSSACTNRKPEPSYVLRSMGLTETEAYASVRFGFSEFNTEKEVDMALDLISEACASLAQYALA